MGDEFEEVTLTSWTDDNNPILPISAAIKITKKIKLEHLAKIQPDELKLMSPNQTKSKSVKLVQRIHAQFLSDIKKPPALPDPNGGVQAYLNFKMPPGLGDIRYICFDPRPGHSGDIILAGSNRLIVVPNNPVLPVQVLDEVVDTLTVAYWKEKFYAFATYSAIATFEIAQPENHTWINGLVFDNLAGRGVFVANKGIYFTEIDQCVCKIGEGNAFEKVSDTAVSDFILHYPSEDLITLDEGGNLSSKWKGSIDLSQLGEYDDIPEDLKFSFPSLKQLYTGDILIAVWGTITERFEPTRRGQDPPNSRSHEYKVFILVDYKSWKISSCSVSKCERAVGGSKICLPAPRRGIHPIFYTYGSKYILLAVIGKKLSTVSVGELAFEVQAAMHYSDKEWILGGRDTLLTVKVGWN